MSYRELPIVMGTASGTFLSSFAALQVEDILISAFLAIIGALVSFMMSCLLNLFIKPKFKRYRRNDKGKRNDLN